MPTTFLLSSWGSVFGVPISVRLGKGLRMGVSGLVPCHVGSLWLCGGSVWQCPSFAWSFGEPGP